MSGLAWVYVAGAGIELLGLCTVAWDVGAKWRTVKEMSDPQWGWKQAEKGEPVTSLFEFVARISAGNLWRAGAGVLLIAVGLVVQTIANVSAL